LYIQEGAGSLTYKKNVHKLVTINTPHSGSPLANIVENKDEVFRWILAKFDKNPYNGALNNLSIGKAPIDSLLNGTDELNRNKVPSHVIHTNDQLSGIAEFADGAVNNFITSPLALKPKFPFVTAPPSPLMIKVKAALFAIKYYAMSNTSCGPTTPINECLEKIYGGKSDLIVSDPSQMGGMTDAHTLFDGYHHMNVLNAPEVQGKVLSLFRAKISAENFSENGFTPGKYVWDPERGTQNARRRDGQDSIKIVSPAYGATYNAGDSVYVVVRATRGIQRMLIGMGYADDLDGFAIQAPDTIFKFKIPEDATDRMNYSVFGFTNSSSDPYRDSSYINIGINPSLVLDSIKIVHPDLNNVKVTIGDSTSIRVVGYYNDGKARNITYNTGLTFSMLGGAVSISALRNVKGIVLGLDELKASYLGKTDSIYVEVVPKVPYDTVKPNILLPVRFASFEAKFNGSKVLVNWQTANESNNNYFDVEHSTDGISFIKVGTVNAKNAINGAAYSYEHLNYAIGRNYYRLKQVDNDGRYTYSLIVVLNIERKSNILIYPNPVQQGLTIDFSSMGNSNASGYINVMNSVGQVLVRKAVQTTTSRVSIDMSSLQKGIYIVELIDTKGMKIFVERVIKN
jgi:hypothetical protein